MRNTPAIVARWWVLAALSLSTAACGDDSAPDPSTLPQGDGDSGAPRNRDGGAPPSGTSSAPADDAGAGAPRDVKDDPHAGDDPPDDAATSSYGACLPYAAGTFDVTPGPNEPYTSPDPSGVTSIERPLIALRWRADQPGLYAVQASGDSADGLRLFVRAGGCDGVLVPYSPLDSFQLDIVHNQGVVVTPAPPNRALQVAAGDEYTFEVHGRIARGMPRPVLVRVDVTLVCPEGTPDGCIDASGGALSCGVQSGDPASASDLECHDQPAPGEVDQRCPDTIYGPDNERVEGCCRPDGVCGHFDPVLGCHLRAQSGWPYWPEQLRFYCDDRALPDPPDFYQCAQEGEPCEKALDCCAHYNYGNASCVDGLCVLPEG